MKVKDFCNVLDNSCLLLLDCETGEIILDETSEVCIPKEFLEKEIIRIDISFYASAFMVYINQEE